MKKRIVFVLVLVFSLFASFLVFNNNEVEAASSYYSSISDTATGSTLKGQLRSLISKQSYISSYDDCKDPSIVKKTDGNSSSSKIVLFWSDIQIAPSWDGGTTWNREHVWPQSQGWFTTSGAGSDLHHIRPCDPSVNSSHNNNPYGIVSTNDYCHTSTANGSVTIDAKCKDGYFEPSDSKKGDTARIIFYLLVRYSQSDSYSITNVAQSMDMLLQWNSLDPVDASEQRRNEAVYAIQGNRNPFIDDSFYADLIWGGAQPGDNPGSGSGSGSGSESGSNTGTTPNVPTSGKVATFEFGSNDTSKSDTDSSSAMSTYSETNNDYTLSLSDLSKVYTSYDASGNSCLKLGTGSAVGTLSFTVPSNIDQVIILVTGYKANNASVTINGSTQTISTHSADSEYTNVTIDTSSNKSISVATTSSGYRCKINTIVFYDFDGSGSGSESGGDSGSNTPVTGVESALSAFEANVTKSSLALDYDCTTYAYSTPGSYSYTFTSKVYSSATATTLNGVKWDPETTLLNSSGTKYYGYESDRGQQFGSSSNPFKEVIIKTTDNILDGVTKVTIQASAASGSDAKVTAYVGGEIIGTTKTLTSSNATYTFTSSAGMRGNIKFRIFQTTAKAIYIKGMSMTYAGGTSYQNSYTLKSGSMRFGSYITKDIFDQLNQTDTKWGVEYAVGNVTNWSTANVKTTYCTPARVASPNATTTSSTGNYYQWALVVKGLNYTYLDNTLTARAFVEYNGVRYYMGSVTYSLRSLASSYLTNGTSEFANHTEILNHIKNY